MKYPFLSMLGLSLCAAFVFAPARRAFFEGRPAQEAFAQSGIAGSPDAGSEPAPLPGTAGGAGAAPLPEPDGGVSAVPLPEPEDGPEAGTAGRPAPLPDPAPETPEPPVTRDNYFDRALFIGDSRTAGLFEYADMGGADAFADSGMNLYKVFQVRLQVDDLGELTLEELLAERQYGRIYLMLGINELGYNQERTAEKYRELVEYLRQAQPEAELILETNMHVSRKKSDGDAIYNNQNIDAFNDCIRDVALEEGLTCIDVNERFDDGEGNLAEEYTSDDAHLLGKYYADWADWIYENRK